MTNEKPTCKFCGKECDTPAKVREHERICRSSPNISHIDMRKFNGRYTHTHREQNETDEYNKNIFTVSIPIKVRNKLDSLTDADKNITRSSIIRDAIYDLIDSDVTAGEIESWNRETSFCDTVSVSVNFKTDVRTIELPTENRSAFVRYAIWQYLKKRNEIR